MFNNGQIQTKALKLSTLTGFCFYTLLGWVICYADIFFSK